MRSGGNYKIIMMIWSQSYETFSMLYSAEHEIYPAHKCLTFISIINTTSERLRSRKFFICQYFSTCEQLKFHAQLS